VYLWYLLNKPKKRLFRQNSTIKHDVTQWNSIKLDTKKYVFNLNSKTTGKYFLSLLLNCNRWLAGVTNGPKKILDPTSFGSPWPNLHLNPKVISHVFIDLIWIQLKHVHACVLLAHGVKSSTYPRRACSWRLYASQICLLLTDRLWVQIEHVRINFGYDFLLAVAQHVSAIQLYIRL
jgi:hypothetical protein